MLTRFAFLNALVLGVLFSLNVAALEVGDQAPCIFVDDYQLNGTMKQQCLRTKEAGKKYLVLEIFTTWCGYCEQNLPLISKLSEEVLPTATTRLVSIDKDEAAFHQWMSDKKDLIKFPVGYDKAQSVKEGYKVNGVPDLYVLDENNKVVFHHLGSIEDPQVLVDIKNLVSH